MSRRLFPGFKAISVSFAHPVWHVSLLGLLLLAHAGAAQTPTITSLAPTRNALTAPVTSSLSLTFSQALAPATISNVRVYSAQAGGRKAGNVSSSAAVITFTPQTAFRPGERVGVSVPATVQGAGGSAAAPQVYQFTTAAGGSGRGNFQAPPGATLTVGNAYGIALGDIDADGDLDLLASNNGSAAPGVSVQLNNGTGSFSAAPTISLSAYPTSVALADVDGDGDLDLLSSVAGSARVSVRLNNGQGGFTAAGDVSVGFSPIQVATGDVDADGDLDFVAVNQASNSVSVRLNNGSGGFSAPTANAEVAVGISSYSVALGDLDADGDLDLVAANPGAFTGGSYSGNTVSVRLNNGSGVFTAPASSAEVAVGTGPIGVTLGDVDGDGDLDLISANNGAGTASVRLNNGSAGFSGGAEFTVGAAPNSVSLADVDADGDLDALVANSGSNSVSLRLNNGSGAFSAPATGAEISVGNGPVHLALGDVDGDGDLDLASANYNGGTVSLRLNANGPLGVKTARAAAPVVLWPNPARAAVRVQVPTAVPTVVLLDGLGRVVRSVAVPARAADVTVPLTGLPAGVYVVRVGGAAQSLVVE